VQVKNAISINLWNETKLDEIHKAKLEGIHKTKQNFAKQKRNKIFAKPAKFLEQNFLFCFVLCFAKQKREENLKP
jgi:hypothetical protein